jgi:membrane protease YdiL (CAAX protease family)
MPLVVFFAITFAVTWPCFTAVAMMQPGPLRTLVLFIGIFAPAMVALLLTARAEGRRGVVALLGRLFVWRTGARWYVFALGYMAAIKIAVALIHRVAMGEWPQFGNESWIVMLAATMGSTLVGGQAGEEIGWRGYALPRLIDRFGFAAATLLLGVIWAVWHLPLFFVSGADTQGQSFPLFVLQVTAMSVAIGWLCVRTNSLLLTMLMHAAVNNTKDIVPSRVPGATNVFAFSTSVAAWLTVILLWMSAAYFIRDTIRRTPTRMNAKEGSDAGAVPLDSVSADVPLAGSESGRAGIAGPGR